MNRLVDYDASSDEETQAKHDGQILSIKGEEKRPSSSSPVFVHKRPKLPALPAEFLALPTWQGLLLFLFVVFILEPKRDVRIIEGEQRLFDHVDGNWPTSAYVPRMLS